MLSRRGVGTAVFGGMLAASFFGIFLIPVLYVVFQWLRETVKRTARCRAAARTAAAPERRHRRSLTDDKAAGG